MIEANDDQDKQQPDPQSPPLTKGRALNAIRDGDGFKCAADGSKMAKTGMNYTGGEALGIYTCPQCGRVAWG